MGYLNKKNWIVEQIEYSIAKNLIQKLHYTGSCSNTATFCFGLFCKKNYTLSGVSMWMNAPAGVSKKYGNGKMNDVLTLSRFVLIPDLPTNSASFLLGSSMKKISKTNKYSCLVTYADSSQNHNGIIYTATNWIYSGTTMGATQWVDSFGNSISSLSTKSIPIEQMRKKYTQMPKTRKKIFVFPLTIKKRLENHQRQLKLF